MNVRLQENEGVSMVLDSAAPGPECGDTSTEAAIIGEKRVLELIAAGQPLASVLEALCRVAEGICQGSHCSIMLLDEKGDRLYPARRPVSRAVMSRGSMFVKLLPAGVPAERLFFAGSK